MLGVTVGGVEKGTFVAATDVIGGHLKNISGLVEEFQNWEDYRDIGASFAIAGLLTRGATYPGQVIFKGTHDLKEWAGLSPLVTS